jgi:cation transport protein ChaC
VKDTISAFDRVKLEAERLSPEELQASLEKMLAEHGGGRDPIWIFGYGSLMWNPEFDFHVRRVATVHGYHRKFCLWSRINRGTVDKPGLVLTLERGGSCRGLAYRLTPETSRDQLSRLWTREMSLGSYIPRWVECRSGGETFEALAFVVNRHCTGYAGKLPLETMVQAIATAQGKYGPCADYLFNTEAALAQHGIRDDHVAQLVQRVRAHMKATTGDRPLL